MEPERESVEISSAAPSASGKRRPYSQHFGATVEMFGDRITLNQVVLLLAYLRYHIQNRVPGDIHVSVGKRLDTEAFTFTVNDEEIPQVKAERKLEIN